MLQMLLPAIIPIATRWVAIQEKLILKNGQLLDPEELENARQMGVVNPEKVRLLLVDEITGPSNFILRKAADALNFFGPGLNGITYRYGIIIRNDRYPDPHLVAHECVHTGQYERLGSISAFLKSYLYECLFEGYPDGPLEREAIDLSAQFDRAPKEAGEDPIAR